ncbi:MAG: hypothetical protein ACJ8C4_02925 [Gemmataceae bacterium]
MDGADPLNPATVHDRESFLTFVRALVADREAAVKAEKRGPTDPRALRIMQDAGGWYNFTIEAYLDAALRWAEDSDMGESQALPASPSWKAFATFLLCGKIYE